MSEADIIEGGAKRLDGKSVTTRGDQNYVSMSGGHGVHMAGVELMDKSS